MPKPKGFYTDNQDKVRPISYPSRRSTLNPRQLQRTREKFMRDYLAETETHDLSEVMTKLRAEAREAIQKQQSQQKQLEKAENIVNLASGKLEAISQILAILDSIVKSGRTRIGDSELKHIIRTTLRELELPPSALEI